MLSSSLQKQINFPELTESKELTHGCKNYLNVAVKQKEVESHQPACLSLFAYHAPLTQRPPTVHRSTTAQEIKDHNYITATLTVPAVNHDGQCVSRKHKM